MCLVFTRMPGETYRSRRMSLFLYLCYVVERRLTHLCVDFARASLFQIFEQIRNEVKTLMGEGPDMELKVTYVTYASWP